MGVARWLLGYGHLMLFQKTRVHLWGPEENSGEFILPSFTDSGWSSGKQAFVITVFTCSAISLVTGSHFLSESYLVGFPLLHQFLLHSSLGF